MMVNISQRQHNILVALIREFISTVEPVSSSSLASKYGFTLSPATIRSELARLEEMGLLIQPHTSAGRIPTDLAYRYYVNHLLGERMELPSEAQPTLQQYKDLEIQMKGLIEYTSRLLSDITNYTSLVLVPHFRKTLFKFLRITPLEDGKALLILMTNTGAILNRMIHLSEDISDEALSSLTETLNNRLSGIHLENISLDLLREVSDNGNPGIFDSIINLAREGDDIQAGRFLVEGTGRLLNYPEFQNFEKLKVLLETIENERAIAEILKQTLSTEGLKVYIGEETSVNEVRECAFVTARYGMEGVPLGTIAVMGPTRMPYSRIIPIVRTFADILNAKMTRLIENS